MNKTDGKIIIFGCGGHSRSVTDVLLTDNPDAVVLLIDENARDGELVNGIPVYRDYLLADEQVFLAIGDNLARKIKLETIGKKNLISIISATAHRGLHSTIGAGCFVGNFCHIGPATMIGNNTILNTASVIEHEVKIGAHCHIGPNATISGRCTIADQVFVGVGATIKDYISICSDVTIGAGATVVKDIIEPGVYVGCPAQRIR